MKLKKNKVVNVTIAVVFAAAAALFMISGNADAEEIKIVSINTGQVLQSHPAFQTAVSKYKAKQEELQQKLSKAEDENQSALQTQMQQELQQLGMNLQKEATDEMKKDVQALAKKNGYDYVIDAEAVIAGKGKNLPDVTGQVIESFSE
jgi:Skp family chaperone for outer membrane proteins